MALTTTLTITGGRRVARFTRILGDGSVIAREAAKILRRRMLPWVRTQVPRRTGRLASSLRIVQRGASVELRANFYGRFNGVPELGVQWVEDNRRSFGQEVIDAVERRLGGA